jgi:Domain of unknown function (DUF4249)
MKKIIIVIAITLGTFLSSCSFQNEEIIEIPNPKKEMAVYIDLSNGYGYSAFVVKKRLPNEPIEWDVNLTDSIYDIQTNKKLFSMRELFNYTGIGKTNLFDFIPNTQVIVYEEGKFFVELKPEFRPVPQYFFNNFTLNKLTPGKKYQIEIKSPGYPTITGEQTAISDVKPERIVFKKNTFQSADNGLLSEVLISFNDPVNEPNSYSCFANLTTINRKNGETVYNKITLYKTDPTSSNNFTISDRSFNGRNYTWRLGADVEPFLKDTIGKDVSLDIEFYTISQDLEKYLKTLEASDRNIDSRFTEPITPYTNIKGGLGIFGISGVSENEQFIIK